MKIIILTTYTKHHLYFINTLIKNIKNIKVVYEKKKINFKFKTWHKYLIKRDKYEKKFFFNNKIPKTKNIKTFSDINSKNSIKYISKINPDILISFGIGLMNKNFLYKFKRKKIVNLHGGHPSYYRGLDSILWSIYHKDFKNLITTLHLVDKNFDTGNIIYKKKIIINKNTKFEHIRAVNTINCVDITFKFLNNLIKRKKIPNIKQKSIGRYYSAMPSALIDQCKKNYKVLLSKLS